MIFILSLKLYELDLLVDVRIKRNNKRIYIRCKKPNVIVITTPVRLSKDKIFDYLLKSYDFIKKELNKPSNTNNINSDCIHFFGKKYKLDIIQTKYNDVILNNDTITIYAKSIDDRTIKHQITLFYINHLKKFVENNIEDAKRLFNISFNVDIEYKNVKSYFGKCEFKKHKITLSSRLCKYEEKYIMSVIYHELAHFYHMNHQDEFYRLLEDKIPNYKKIQKDLRKIKFFDMY